MRRFWQWFCGYICVCIKGRQVNRFLNLCSRNGIHLWRITYDMQQSLRANLRLRDFYDIKPYLRKTKTRVRVIAKKGFPFWCHRHGRLKWFLCILFCLLCIGCYSLNFIWNIEIKGNHQVSTKDIMSCLTQNNIETGRKRNEIDCSNIEIMLREQFHQLGWVSVYFEHTKLCIDIKESLYDEMEHEEDNYGRQYNLIANKDAVIASIVTREGKAIVKKGEAVKSGDVLVLGQCEIYDDNGEIKEILYFPADALIYGDVVYNFTLPVTEIEIMSLRIANSFDDEMLLKLGIQKINPIIERLEANGVIILDKSIMINKKEQDICFQIIINAREQIGINIPAEEVRENEFE